MCLGEIISKSIGDADENIATKEVSEEYQHFEKLILTNEKAYILQGQVGVSAFGKKCPKCQRELQIQWPRTAVMAKTDNFLGAVQAGISF